MRRIVAPPPADHFEGIHAPAGDAQLVLHLGDLAIRFRGLPGELSDRLQERYAKFTVDRFEEGLDVDVCDAGRDYYIDPPEVGELNPVNLVCDGDRVRFVGYRLAAVFDTVGSRGRVMLAHGERESADGAMENFIRAAIAWRAAELGGALVHAASAVLDGRGYLFYGESGAGKSTLSECNRRATIVSDDLSLVLRATGDRPELIGTPFRGTYEEGERVVGRFPVAAGFRLVQDKVAKVERVPRVRALSELVANLPFVAEGFARRPDLFDKVQHTFDSIPLMHLHFCRDDTYWDAIQEAGL